MIKYNIAMCCYDKILVNVAALCNSWLGVCVCVCVWCEVNRNRKFSSHHIHTHKHLTRNYICGHIYQDFIITDY